MGDGTPRSSSGTIDAPFEWLTNFRSLRHLVLPSRIAYCPAHHRSSLPSLCHDDDYDESNHNRPPRRDTSPSCPSSSTSDHMSRRRLTSSPSLSLNALHVGCGTSAVGESLFCLREHTCRGAMLRYGNVINVDNDVQALEKMRRRWEGRARTTTTTTTTTRRRRMEIRNDIEEESDANYYYDDDDGESSGKMEWICIDYGSDESCESAMDGVYRRLMDADRRTAGSSSSSCVGDGDESGGGGCFDLVLDKSTLDCLLCAETSIVARFLCEVYRALRPPPPPPHHSPPSLASHADDDRDIDVSRDKTPRRIWGGAYVLVSFHPVEFVEKLLMRLPGADWHVEHEVIRREVEDVAPVNGGVVHVVVEDEVDHDASNDIATPAGEANCPPSSYAWSSGTFRPDENYRRTVNVYTCRRCRSTRADADDYAPLCPAAGNLRLDREEVRMHVERTCDEWYRATNPMLTSEREGELRAAFKRMAAKMNTTGDDRGGKDAAELSSCDDVMLDLETCYEIIFTAAEKEHLAYEHFIEDWRAYCLRGDSDDSSHDEERMTVSTALDFLTEMQ